MSDLKYLRDDEREMLENAEKLKLHPASGSFPLDVMIFARRLNEARAKTAEIHAITQTQVQELWQANVLLSQIAMKARTDIPAPPEEPK